MKNLLITIFKQNDASQELWAKLFRNFSWLFAGAAGKLIFGLIATLYLARILGPLGFGQVSFALAVLAYFIMITDCGLQALGTREIAAGSEDKGQIVGKILTIRFVRTRQLFFVPIIFVGSHILSALYLAGIYTRRDGLLRLSTSAKESWKFFCIAVPIVVTLFLHQIYFNFDTLMLGFFRSETEVGLYNAAYHVIMAIIALNTVFMESIYPTFSKLHRIKPFEVSKFLEKTLSLSIVFAIPIGIAGTILGKSIIEILYGTKFADSTFAFQILVWSASLAFIGANYGYCLVACQQQKALAIAAGIGTAANVALNFLLIPKYGILGASLATLIAQVIMLICEFKAYALRVKPTFPLAWLTLKASVAGIGMGLVLICFNSFLNFIMLVVIGVIVYFSILGLLRGFRLHKLLSLFREINK